MAASQASGPGEALLCIEASQTREWVSVRAFDRGRRTRYAIIIASGLRFGDGRFVLAQARQQLGEVAGPVADVELGFEDLVPAVATGAG